MKGLLAHHGTLLKTIAPGNSNAMPIERDFRSCRNFLSRFPGSYNSWSTLYSLSLWLNLFCNVQLIGGRRVSPYELHHGFKPYLDRHLKLELPNEDYCPIASDVNRQNWARSSQKTPKNNPKKSQLKIGDQVQYKKYSLKDPSLKRGKIIKLSDDTCNIKSESGLVVTRLYRDVIT